MCIPFDLLGNTPVPAKCVKRTMPFNKAGGNRGVVVLPQSVDAPEVIVDEDACFPVAAQQPVRS